MEWKSSSLASWLLFLLLLNILDILLTNPAYEANPFTLYFWGQIGIFLSSWIARAHVDCWRFQASTKLSNARAQLHQRV